MENINSAKNQKDPEIKETVKRNPCSDEKNRGWNFGGIFFGIILIFAGFIYLGNTTGLFNIDIDLWQFWPVFIILAGLSMISGRGWFGSLFGIVITLIIIGVAAIIIFGKVDLNSSNSAIYQKTIAVEKEPEVKSAIIDVKIGAADFKIRGGANNLISGIFDSNFSQLTVDSETENDIQKVSLKGKDYLMWQIFGRKWTNLDLKVNSDIPVAFNIETGAMDMDFDLSDVIAEDIDIDTGASDLKIVLGDKAESAKLSINAGASSVEIVLPRTLGVKVNIDSGLSSKNLIDFKQINSNTYQSENYEISQKKLDVDLNLGVSSLDITWK